MTKIASPASAPERKATLPRLAAEADHRNGNQNALRIRGGFTAHDGNIIFPRERADAGVNPFDETGVKSFRQRDRDERGGTGVPAMEVSISLKQRASGFVIRFFPALRRI